MDNFKLNISSLESIVIEPNYENYRAYNRDDKIMVTMVSDEEECCLGITLEQAKAVANYLNEVIKYIENKPKIGDKVEIVNGMFADFKGVITDIDEHDKDNPVVVQISKTSYNDEFLVFVNYDEVVLEDKQ